jgi:F-type H+/Na+-transporting ATPase subunit beta
VTDSLLLNVPLLKRRVPNLTTAARGFGLRAATVSDLCTGKIPVARAEVRTLVALASLANCTLDELVLRVSPGALIETGIKVLDLFAPLVRGGTTGLVARPGLGQMVVLMELMHRLRQRRGFAAVLWLPAEPDPYFTELQSVADGVGRSPEEVGRLAAAARLDRDVLIAADRQVLLTGELLDLRESLHEPGNRPITFALVDAKGESPDEDAPYGPLDTLWRFDTDMAVRGVYPAVDPVRSTSTLLEAAQLEATHLSACMRARKLLRRYQELRALVAVRGIDRLPVGEQQTFARGERLEAFLSQPFYVAEPHTQKPGVWVSLDEALVDVRNILDGATDKATTADLRMIGRLPNMSEVG